MTLPDPRARLQILRAARGLLAEQGFARTTLGQLADRADLPLGEVCAHFPSMEHLALAMYDALATELSDQAGALPAGTVMARFRWLMAAKLDLLEAQREALLSLVARAFDPSARAGVLGPHTRTVRSRVSGLFAMAAAGASPPPADVARTGRFLYGLHLLFILLWTQDQTPERQSTRRALALCARLGEQVGPLLAMSGQASRLAAEVDAIVGPLLRASATEPASALPRRILERLLDRRRCLVDTPPSAAALALHEPTVRRFVDAGAPIAMVLPAFPAKAPNRRKVLGALPDMAEEVALRSLQRLCADLAEAHPPGAVLTVASDGHVFADVVGVSDADVDAYGARMQELAAQLGGPFRFFSLRDVYPGLSPDEARAALLAEHAETTAALREKIAADPALESLSNGIHRFMAEDLALREPGLSRSQVKKRSRGPAVEVVRRSRAWGRLVADAFPDALRLSIHPQPDVSPKLGVHLIDTDDIWLTPWHGAAVLDGERFRLMRRADAEALGAVVVRDDSGRPSHLELPR